MPPCTKRGPYKNGLLRSVWKNLAGPDLNPIEHLKDELEHQLRARPNRPKSVPNLTKALGLHGGPRSNVPTSSGKPFQKNQLHINAHGWNEMLNEQMSTYFWSYSLVS
jgi:hypothetical protein